MTTSLMLPAETLPLTDLASAKTETGLSGKTQKRYTADKFIRHRCAKGAPLAPVAFYAHPRKLLPPHARCGLGVHHYFLMRDVFAFRCPLLVPVVEGSLSCMGLHQFFSVSERTIRSWRAAGAPLKEPAKMNLATKYEQPRRWQKLKLSAYKNYRFKIGTLRSSGVKRSSLQKEKKRAV